MAISAKWRRRIEVDGTRYLWWVTETLEDDFFGSLALTIASENRQLLVRYGLSQDDEHRFVVVMGPAFQGVPGLGGPWRRFRCPSVGTSSRVSPKDVASFIRWCLTPGDPPVEVSYRYS